MVFGAVIPLKLKGVDDAAAAADFHLKVHWAGRSVLTPFGPLGGPGGGDQRRPQAVQTVQFSMAQPIYRLPIAIISGNLGHCLLLRHSGQRGMNV